MKQLLCEKYKPTTLSEFKYGIDTIQSLQLIQRQQLYNLLIVGENGSGKTTLLNYFIDEYFGNIPKSHINENILVVKQMKDISIQYFRSDIKIFCQSYSTIRNKKKVIVIDDIDNIQEQNQQILRSFIDHYGKSLFFIVTCTHTNKVLHCLQSRLHIFTLPKVTSSQIDSIANEVFKRESINITPQAKVILTCISNNSIRKLHTYLQLFYLYDNDIDEVNIFEICNTIPFMKLESFFKEIRMKHVMEAYDILKEFVENGYSCIDIYEHIFLFLKQDCNLDEDFKYWIVQKLAYYMYIFHEIHEDNIELLYFTFATSKYSGKMAISV